MAEAIATTPRVTSDLSTGDLGSHVLTLGTANRTALRRVVEEIGSGFRKVAYDLVCGVAEFMAPSRSHDCKPEALKISEDAVAEFSISSSQSFSVARRY